VHPIIPLSLLAPTLLGAADPKIDRLTSDLQAVQAAHADSVMLALTQCAGEKIRGYTPTDDELGKVQRASDFLKQSLEMCGLKDAETRARALLKEAAPTASAEDIDRQVSSALVMPLMVLMMALNDKFRVPSPPGPRELPLTIPCPPADQPQPDACRHQ
jgi:hypothetical protein